MIKHIRHPGIVTDELEPLLHFYRDLLGFEIVAQAEEEGQFIDTILGLQGVCVTTVKMKTSDGSILELLNYKSHPRLQESRVINDIGISHIAFTVDDVDSDYQCLGEKGVKFYSSPQTNPEGTAKVVFCEDPKGNILELVQII
jgi:catechol 2,3-dioxygenase-like lactoylglutathione lyase family enzyme